MKKAFLILTVLAICLVALPRFSAQDVEGQETLDYDSALAQLRKAEAAGEYDKALTIAETAMEGTFERQTEMLYDIARLHALKGDKSKAYHYLFWATDSGFWDRKRMLEDTAFADINQEELFKKLARKAWSNGYLWMLEREQREEFQKKDEILEALGLKQGMYVADVGAGSGYFTIPIARMVGEEGTVLATDIRQEMLDYIDRRLQIEQLNNVELLLSEPDDPMLPAGKVDLILMVDVYHYIKERTAFGEKLLPALSPGGRLIVIDYIPKPWEERPWGPPPSQKLAEETLSADLAAAGFKIIEKQDFLPEQFFVVYGRK